jgi:hypothetical protein
MRADIVVGENVKYIEGPFTHSQEQFITRSNYLVNFLRDCGDLSDFHKWLSEGCGYLKYM